MVFIRSIAVILTVLFAVNQWNTTDAGTFKCIDDFSGNHGGWWERYQGDDATAVI